MTSADLLVRQYYLFKIHLPIFLLIRFTINSWNSSRSSPFRRSKYRDGNVDNWNQGNEFLTFLLNCIVITPLQVVDLLAPYQKGGKIGLFGGAGVGKTVFIMELINNIAKGHGVFIVQLFDKDFQIIFVTQGGSLFLLVLANVREKETIFTMK